MVDPWAGSYYVESLTHELMHKAWQHIEEIETLGGMAKAIETGLPKMRIEEAAARRQARIDSGRETIVGVNKYRLAHEEPLRRARGGQPGRARIAVAPAGGDSRARATQTAVQQALDALTASAKTGEGNLLELAVDAARVRATLGEISGALEKVFGRYQAVSRTISGVYSSESQGDPEFQKARAMAQEFAELEGRRPRILVAKMGQDGHDRGAKVIATAFADLGLRRGRRSAVPDSARSRAHGGGERRPRAGRFDAGGRPQDAGAGSDRRAETARARRTFWCSSAE